MITIWLQGGLGNMMLQYSTALSMAKRLGVGLQLDVTSYRNDKLRQYNLNLFEGVNEPLVYDSIPTIREKGLPYEQDIVDRVRDSDVLLGYFPTEKYFDSIKREVWERFQPRQILPVDTIDRAAEIQEVAGDRATFLTVRRTDYVAKQDFHGVLPMDYYRRAIQYLREQGVDPEIYVFSDEPEWCKQYLDIGMPFRVVGSYDQTTPTHIGREDADLHLMSLCNHAITANSSFSWWGAWLGEQRKEAWGLKPGIITAPKQWFTTKSVDSRDITPKRWVEL